MKFTNNSVGMLIFFALATTVFVLMALRPAVDRTAMNLGVPLSSEAAVVEAVTESTETLEGNSSAQKENPISTDLNAEADESEASDATTTEPSAEKEPSVQNETPISTELNAEAEESDPNAESATEESKPTE